MASSSTTVIHNFSEVMLAPERVRVTLKAPPPPQTSEQASKKKKSTSNDSNGSSRTLLWTVDGTIASPSLILFQGHDKMSFLGKSLSKWGNGQNGGFVVKDEAWFVAFERLYNKIVDALIEHFTELLPRTTGEVVFDNNLPEEKESWTAEHKALFETHARRHICRKLTFEHKSSGVSSLIGCVKPPFEGRIMNVAFEYDEARRGLQTVVEQDNGPNEEPTELSPEEAEKILNAPSREDGRKFAPRPTVPIFHAKYIFVSTDENRVSVKVVATYVLLRPFSLGATQGAAKKARVDRSVLTYDE